VIRRWAEEGKLRVETRGYDTDHDAWCVDPAAILEFLREHRDLYDLRRIDQEAFLALVFDPVAPRVAARPRTKAA